jgi:hypothetical protein
MHYLKKIKFLPALFLMVAMGLFVFARQSGDPVTHYFCSSGANNDKWCIETTSPTTHPGYMCIEWNYYDTNMCNGLVPYPVYPIDTIPPLP